MPPGSQIARNVKPGSECALYGRVTDVNGKPLADATVSIWQTGADGLYDIQESATEVDYRGVFTTDANGLYLAANGEADRLLDPDGWPGRPHGRRCRDGTACGRRIFTSWSARRAIASW